MKQNFFIRQYILFGRPLCPFKIWLCSDICQIWSDIVRCPTVICSPAPMICPPSYTCMGDLADIEMEEVPLVDSLWGCVPCQHAVACCSFASRLSVVGRIANLVPTMEAQCPRVILQDSYQCNSIPSNQKYQIKYYF